MALKWGELLSPTSNSIINITNSQMSVWCLSEVNSSPNQLRHLIQGAQNRTPAEQCMCQTWSANSMKALQEKLLIFSVFLFLICDTQVSSSSFCFVFFGWDINFVSSWSLEWYHSWLYRSPHSLCLKAGMDWFSGPNDHCCGVGTAWSLSVPAAEIT